MNDEALDFSAILRSGRCLWALLTLIVSAGAFGQSDNVTHEIAGLKDPDYKIRASAARTLGTMKDPRAVAALIAALNQSSGMEERVPASSLGRIGALAVDPALKDTNSDIRAAAVAGIYGHRDAPGFLLTPFDFAGLFYRRDWREARDPRVIDLLIAALLPIARCSRIARNNSSCLIR